MNMKHLSITVITKKALLIANRQGLDMVTMRSLAKELDVQQGALYYYVDSKQALLAFMAQAVAEQVLDAYLANTPQEPLARVLHCAWSLRQTIRKQRDGARLLAYSPLAQSPAALQLMEHLVIALEEFGVPTESVHDAADVLLSYVTGFVLQEQQQILIDPASSDQDDRTFTRGLEIIVGGLPC